MAQNLFRGLAPMEWKARDLCLFAAVALCAVACGGAQYASSPAAMTTSVESTGGSWDAEEAIAYDEDDGDYNFESDDMAGEMRRAAAPPPEPGAVQHAPDAEPVDQTTVAEAETGQPEPDQQQAADAGTSGPLLIYEARLNLAVHEVRERMAQVIEVADNMGGFLARQDDTAVIIRVPAARFREALTSIEELGDLLSRQVRAQDVSEQFRDIRIRLQNALQMRDQMAGLLERAGNVAESLAIQRELERLTETIELLRGQLRSLQDRIAFSTITVSFQPVQTEAQVPRERFRLPFPWLYDLGLQSLMGL